MTEPLYKIEEQFTDGWFVIKDCENLNREECRKKYNFLLQEGHNPNLLKIIRIV